MAGIVEGGCSASPDRVGALDPAIPRTEASHDSRGRRSKETQKKGGIMAPSASLGASAAATSPPVNECIVLNPASLLQVRNEETTVSRKRVIHVDCLVETMGK